MRRRQARSRATDISLKNDIKNPCVRHFDDSQSHGGEESPYFRAGRRQ